MEGKKKRYEIQSMVRVPDLDDIKKAAADFSEGQAADELNRDFIARNAKHLVNAEDTNKFNPGLNTIKKEMLQLAMVVASSESEKRKDENEDSITPEAVGDAISQDPAEVSNEAEAETETEAEAETVLPDEPESGT